jgi:hypothetical protein
MARKRDNTRHLVKSVTQSGPVFVVQNSNRESVATCVYLHGSRPTDRYAMTCLTIRLDNGKSYELIIRPRKVELLENSHGN